MSEGLIIVMLWGTCAVIATLVIVGARVYELYFTKCIDGRGKHEPETICTHSAFGADSLKCRKCGKWL